MEEGEKRKLKDEKKEGNEEHKDGEQEEDWRLMSDGKRILDLITGRRAEDNEEIN